ncbi:unnamed protein product [Microthlaspi erraticum]|uniref:Uncharacterized protein n=1 Tax=Microthlaspi erraticum TaxID=1685480 RepID=A0A6D2K7W9_9BRAS|nr:unnamed protein product [Microthlaspi erraticum]
MQKSMDKMVSKIKSLEKKVSGSSSKKRSPRPPQFLRSRSLLTTPRRLPAQEPHRASSFEPREGEDNTLIHIISHPPKIISSICVCELDRVGLTEDLVELDLQRVERGSEVTEGTRGT